MRKTRLFIAVTLFSLLAIGCGNDASDNKTDYDSSKPGLQSATSADSVTNADAYSAE